MGVPMKTGFTVAVLAGGLALGLGILYLLAASDKSLYNERDVELGLKLPVLTMVPMLDVATAHAKRTMRALDKSYGTVTTKG